MDASTGKPTEGVDHLRQSISDILMTPTGTRVMRRTYGSRLLELVDAPFNEVYRLRLFAAIATALLRWEPRISITQVSIAAGDRRGAFYVDIEGERTDLPKSVPLKISVPVRSAGGSTLS